MERGSGIKPFERGGLGIISWVEPTTVPEFEARSKVKLNRAARGTLDSVTLATQQTVERVRLGPSGAGRPARPRGPTPAAAPTGST